MKNVKFPVHIIFFPCKIVFLNSLIAATQSKCSEVYAIDSSVVMCHIVEEVKMSSKVDQRAASKVTVINKISSDMNIPDDMPQK